MSRQLPPLIIALVTAAACSAPAPTESLPVAGRAGPAPAAASGVAVVLDGLDSPRGIAFGPEGALYVAEAGNTTRNGPCVQVFRGENCYSGTGAITRLFKGRRERVVSGLPSVFNPATNDISGPHDIGFLGRGNAAVTIGWGASPAARAGFGELATGFGYLIQLSAGGQWKPIADISGVEAAENPAGGNTDSNPYGVLKEPNGWLVTDAGGNSLIAVGQDGATSVVSTFAPTPAPPPFNQSEAVPTAVERGPDGALYVSKLTGAPFIPGAAAIMRVAPGQAPTVFVGGFKMIIDFTFAPDGGVYVLEYDTNPAFFFGGPGRLTHVAPGGARTVITTALSQPTSVALGPDGALYVSNRGNAAGVGEVLRIVP